MINRFFNFGELCQSNLINGKKKGNGVREARTLDLRITQKL